MSDLITMLCVSVDRGAFESCLVGCQRMLSGTLYDQLMFTFIMGRDPLFVYRRGPPEVFPSVRLPLEGVHDRLPQCFRDTLVHARSSLRLVWLLPSTPFGLGPSIISRRDLARSHHGVHAPTG